MKIIEYGMDDLKRARELQDEMAKLHIPTPVLHWNYEIKSADGEVVEIGRGKSNSYTRNALNMLAANAGMCAHTVVSATSFADGYVNYKTTAGAIAGTAAAGIVRYYPASASHPAVVVIGSGTGPESLDSYALPTLPITGGAQSAASVFNSTTRKLVTTLSRAFTNTTGAAVDITEAAAWVYVATNTSVLMVRDVFPAIAVPDGKTIVWTYTTEVAYPNP